MAKSFGLYFSEHLTFSAIWLGHGPHSIIQRNEKGEMKEPCCEICDGYENLRRAGAWLMGVDLIICSTCFGEWYDGGSVDREVIREKSLKKQGRAIMDFQI